MKNKLGKTLFLVLLALISFIVFVALILMFQGRLNQESLQQAFKRDKVEDKQPVQAEPLPRFFFPLPPPFTFEEVTDLAQSLKDKKKEYEKKAEALKMEREELTRIRKDLDERKQEMKVMMEKISTLMLELEEKKKVWKEEQLTFKDKQKKNLKKLAKMFESMDVDQAAERINRMESTVGAKILFMMSARNSSKILSQLEPNKVKALTQLMQKVEDSPKE